MWLSADRHGLTAGRLAALTALGWLLAVAVGWWRPQMTWIALLLAGLLASALLARAAGGGAGLAGLAIAAFAVRAAAAVALFAVSLWRLPVLRSLQREHGLWQFGGDGVGYHEHALKILDAWRWGIDLGSVFRVETLEYSLYRDLSLPIALVYRLFGPSPLNFALVNAVLGALTVVLAYLLGRRLGDEQGGLVAAALVGFWPSFIIWSTQLLKDTIVLAAIFGALYCLVAAWQPPARLLAWPGLVAAVLAVTYFRFYMGYVLVGAALVAFGAGGARALLSRRWSRALLAAGLVLVVGAAVQVARSADVLALLSPNRPEVGYLNRGLDHQRRGDLEQARRDYERALDLNARYEPALRNLAAVLAEQGRREEATEALERASMLARGLASDRSTARPVEQSRSRVVAAARDLAYLLSPEGLNETRAGLLRWGGIAHLDPEVRFAGPADVVGYAPRALALAFLAPFPWQWFEPSGETGTFKMLSGAEMMLLYALLPLMAVAAWKLLRGGCEEGWLLLSFVALSAVGLGLATTNVGILFRLRLQFLLPMLVAVAATWASRSRR